MCVFIHKNQTATKTEDNWKIQRKWNFPGNKMYTIKSIVHTHISWQSHQFACENVRFFIYTLGHGESAKMVACALLSLYRCDKLRFLRRQKMYFENFCLNFVVCESHPNVWKFKAETKVCRRWLRNSDPKFKFSKSSFKENARRRCQHHSEISERIFTYILVYIYVCIMKMHTFLQANQFDYTGLEYTNQRPNI